jgi:hypothetical protein
MLEKLATESNHSYTTGNVFNIELIGTEINNQPDSVLTENGSKNIRDYHRKKVQKLQ